jgi:uncharacterized protein (DUF2235 family)
MSKTIILLADGTGNSAAKLFKTNVWRLYKALDLNDPPPHGEQRQIAYYHDGVGTSTFKPLTILGGAFGVGLKRNVMDMYAFLCRNYLPGDRIYVFGFSRGAFTVRVLASVITTQGILTCPTEEELHRYAPDAYRRYRRRYKLPIFGYKDKTAPTDENENVGLVDLLRNLRDGVIKAWRAIRHFKQYDEVRVHNAQTNVDFIGVWDTVAAYGLPIDELTRGIDDWVWPLSMPNYALSPKVVRARHALSLDDERDTFHPLLWDEVAEEKLVAADPTRAGRLQQVWFAGMHSNVGGGYADDSLSFGALEWMMAESAKPLRAGETAGLRFLPMEERETAPTPRDDFGTMYNSRSGVGSYYRYQPRKIAARLEHPDPTTIMMQDPNRNGVGFLKSITLHESVFHRVSAGNDRYAPIVVPDRFQVLKSDGTIEPHQLPLPSPGEARQVSRTEWVWNDVWRRRVNYFTTVAVSIILAALPLIHVFWPPSVCTGPQCVLAPVITTAGEVLPGFVQPWIRAFAISPGLSVVLALCILLLLARSASLKRSINDGMRELWLLSLGRLKPEEAVTYAGRYPNGPTGGIYGVRSRTAYQTFFQWLKWRTIPGVFGLSVLVGGLLLAAAIILVAAQRADIAWSERTNRYCQLTPKPPETSGLIAKPFKTIEKCWASGVSVTKGRRYAIALRVTKDWVDRTIPTSPAGFESSRLKWYTRPSVLLRRSLSGRWFEPMLKIVPAHGRGGHIELLDMRCNCGQGPVYTAEFEAARSGEVALFVNDVMPPLWGDLLPARWSALKDLYQNNQGEAEVTITEIPANPPARAATP